MRKKICESQSASARSAPRLTMLQLACHAASGLLLSSFLDCGPRTLYPSPRDDLTLAECRANCRDGACYRAEIFRQLRTSQQRTRRPQARQCCSPQPLLTRCQPSLSFDEIERRYSKSEHGSKSRPPPETPTWRLTSATDGSEDTLKADESEFPREKTSIQFVEGNPMRGRQRNGELAACTNMGFPAPKQF